MKGLGTPKTVHGWTEECCRYLDSIASVDASSWTKVVAEDGTSHKKCKGKKRLACTASGVAVSRHLATSTPGRGFGSDLAILGENIRRE